MIHQHIRAGGDGGGGSRATCKPTGNGSTSCGIKIKLLFGCEYRVFETFIRRGVGQLRSFPTARVCPTNECTDATTCGPSPRYYLLPVLGLLRLTVDWRSLIDLCHLCDTSSTTDRKNSKTKGCDVLSLLTGSH
jgi:hypothetical protein